MRAGHGTVEIFHTPDSFSDRWCNGTNQHFLDLRRALRRLDSLPLFMSFYSNLEENFFSTNSSDKEHFQKFHSEPGAPPIFYTRVSISFQGRHNLAVRATHLHLQNQLGLPEPISLSET